MTDRIVERTDGVTTERTTEMGTAATPTTTIIERRGGGSSAIVWAIIGLALVAIVAFFLVRMSDSRAARDAEVGAAASSAAESVGEAAGAIGDAADRAADTVNPN